MGRKLETREEFIARRVRGTRCDCGGPQSSTAHAPDCRLMLAADAAAEEWPDELFQRKLADIDRRLSAGHITQEEADRLTWEANH